MSNTIDFNDAEEVAAIVACLGDDAATLRDAYTMDEISQNMDAAAALIDHQSALCAELEQQLEAARKDVERLRAHIQEAADAQGQLSALAALAGDSRMASHARNEQQKHLDALKQAKESNE